MANTDATAAIESASSLATDMDANYESQLPIEAPPEAVFDALTTLPGLAGWWTVVSGSGLAGGELRFVFDDDELIMTVTVAERPSMVRWTCEGYKQLPDWAGTEISFDVQTGEQGGCVLSFVHAGLTPRLECYSDCKSGWDHFLPSLRDFVESGNGRPWGSGADVQRREDRVVQRNS